MKFLFAGTPRDALLDELRLLSHEVYCPKETDWWNYQFNPNEWANKTCELAQQLKPDVFVLHKGWRWYENANLWCVPVAALWHLRKHCGRMVYMCFDDPAATPITLSLNIISPFNLWLTTCIGIKDLFDVPKKVQVEEYWLAWDTNIITPLPVNKDYECDVTITGHPYYKPFPSPHYQHGFGIPRAELAKICIEKGWKLSIWGPNTWLNSEHGGDALLAPWYKGWIDPSLIHMVHRNAKVTLATHLVEGYRYESGRIPWTGGAGGCLAHEHRPGLEEEFGGSIGWFKYGDLQAAIDKVEFLLNHDDIRNEMSQQLQQKILANHTWKHRAERLIELVK